MANTIFPSFQFNDSDYNIYSLPMYTTTDDTKQDPFDQDHVANHHHWTHQDPETNQMIITSSSSYDQERLSISDMLMIAGERFIRFSTNTIDGVSMFFHPYTSSLSHVPNDDSRDIDLLHTILSAADHVSKHRFDQATKLVSRSLPITSISGTPAQRISYYFLEALLEKIHKRGGNKSNRDKMSENAKCAALGTNLTFLATHQELPFAQVVQFAGVQAIIEKARKDGNFHLIDLQIRSGIHCTALMQGLAELPIKHLKITAIGTTDQCYIEETGKRLQSFAESLSLPFSFRVVYLTEMKDFTEEVLEINGDETVAVYSFMMLRSMISKPETLENVMSGIARARPAVMVVIEVEANHNSPSFIDRFMESLLFCSAYFDCLEECMGRESPYRMIVEGTYLGEGVMNTVAAEGKERVARNVKLEVWREYFRRFGMVEMELSESSKYQASLVVNRFGKGKSCDLEWDGKGLVVGWKGTPLQSLTAWKFSYTY
ncbi:hypothetical protein ACS0TY_012881 [Phlomoides rotata]